MPNTLTFQPGTYDAWQTTFFLSLLANEVSGVTIVELLNNQSLADAQIAAQSQFENTLKSILTDAFTQSSIQGLIGNDWQIAWGPVVLVDNSPSTLSGLTAKFVQNNAMYLAYSPGNNRYVLAIAATNPNSVYDWLTEDLTLTPGYLWSSVLKNWQSGAPLLSGSSSEPTIDFGTYTGVTNLLQMQDPGTTKTLVEYLAAMQTIPPETTLTVTGHSLAGALSPTLALALPSLQANWTDSNIKVYATAGASPGNKPFADTYLSAFPPSGPDPMASSNSLKPWQVWNAVIWNKLDVVPSAWTFGAPLFIGNLDYWAASFNASGEYSITDSAFLTEIVANNIANIANPFISANGSFVHLNPPSTKPDISPRAGIGLLNYEVKIADGFAWTYTGPNTTDVQTGALLTNAQAAQLGIKSSYLVSPFIPTQVLYQHVQAYQELILG